MRRAPPAPLSVLGVVAALGAVLGAAALAPAVARAQASPPRKRPLVHVELASCLEVPRGDVLRVVAVELPLLTGTPGPDTTRVVVGCEGELAAIRVDDPLTGKSLSRAVDLRREPPDARARLLALAIVELISASWTELEKNPSPRVAPAAVSPSPEARRAALEVLGRRPPPERAPRRLRLTAAFGGQAYLSGLGLLLGGVVGVGQDHRSGLGWSVDLAPARGLAELPLSAGSPGRVGAFTVSAAPALLYHRGFGRPAEAPGVRRFHLRAGGGFRVGAARVGVELLDAPDARQSRWGVFGGPFATVALTGRLSSRLVAVLGVDGGYDAIHVRPTLVQPDGSRERVAAVEGGWVGFRLGLELGL